MVNNANKLVDQHNMYANIYSSGFPTHLFRLSKLSPAPVLVAGPFFCRPTACVAPGGGPPSAARASRSRPCQRATGSTAGLRQSKQQPAVTPSYTASPRSGRAFLGFYGVNHNS